MREHTTHSLFCHRHLTAFAERPVMRPMLLYVCSGVRFSNLARIMSTINWSSGFVHAFAEAASFCGVCRAGATAGPIPPRGWPLPASCAWSNRASAKVWAPLVLSSSVWGTFMAATPAAGCWPPPCALWGGAEALGPRKCGARRDNSGAMYCSCVGICVGGASHGREACAKCASCERGVV